MDVELITHTNLFTIVEETLKCKMDSYNTYSTSNAMRISITYRDVVLFNDCVEHGKYSFHPLEFLENLEKLKLIFEMPSINSFDIRTEIYYHYDLNMYITCNDIPDHMMDKLRNLISDDKNVSFNEYFGLS